MQRSVASWLAILLTVACGQSFKLTDFPTPATLYAGAMAEYQKEKWANVVTALEQVTLELPARDTLLPRAHYYLAIAHGKQKDFQLSAASYTRLFESYPEDSLADDAIIGAADAYAKSWRGPSTDPEFAIKSLEAYELLLRLYPTSPLLPAAKAGEARMNEGLARKDLETGKYYYRNHAYDSALIYFGYAVREYPSTPAAREAQIMMVKTFERLRYAEDAREVCRALRSSYAADAEVREVCRAHADTTG